MLPDRRRAEAKKIASVPTFFAAETLEQSYHATCGNVLDRFVAEAESGCPCAEYILVHRESRIVNRNRDTFACAGHQLSPANPIDIKKVELGGTPWHPLWDQIIEQALPPEVLSSQVPWGVRRFCPRFFEMGTTDKRTFWAYFFQALAGAEAGLNPNTSVRNTEPEGTMALRSEGLLQLAYADHKRYGCDFNWQVDRAQYANNSETRTGESDRYLVPLSLDLSGNVSGLEQTVPLLTG